MRAADARSAPRFPAHPTICTQKVKPEGLVLSLFIISRACRRSYARQALPLCVCLASRLAHIYLCVENQAHWSNADQDADLLANQQGLACVSLPGLAHMNLHLTTGISVLCCTRCASEQLSMSMHVNPENSFLAHTSPLCNA